MNKPKTTGTSSLATAPIKWAWRMIVRMFAADSFLTRSVLQGDALSRFLSTAKPGLREVKAPRTGLIPKEGLLPLLPELDPKLAEDIEKGKVLVSEIALFSIWPLPPSDRGEHRATIWLATRDMIPKLPFPDNPCFRCLLP